MSEPSIKLRVVAQDGDSFRSVDLIVPLDRILVAYQGLQDKWTTLLVKQSYNYTQKLAVMEFPDTIMGLMVEAIKDDIRQRREFYTKKSRYPLPSFFDGDDMAAVFYCNNIESIYELARRHTRVVFNNGYSMSINGQPVQIRNGASQMFQELKDFKEDV